MQQHAAHVAENQGVLCQATDSPSCCADLRKEPLRWCGMCGMYDSSTYLHPSKKLLRCNGCLTVGYCSQVMLW